MEDRIAHYMVTFTAKQWPEAYRRALEVEELPKKGSQRMAAAVTAAAARLGYKQRNFFKSPIQKFLRRSNTLRFCG